MGLNCKIKMDLSEYTKVNKLFNTVLSERITDNQKPLCIWLKGDLVRFGATNGDNKTVVKKMNATVEYLDGQEHVNDEFVSISFKDLESVVSMFNSLKKTKVTGFEIDITDTGAIVRIKEEALDENFPNAELYNLESKYVIPLITKVAPAKFYLNTDFVPEGMEIESEIMAIYLSTLTDVFSNATLNKGKSTVNFGKSKTGYAYVFLQNNNRMVMKNLLPLEDISFSVGDMALLKALFSAVKSVQVSISEPEAGLNRKSLKMYADDIYVWLKAIPYQDSDVASLFAVETPASIVLDRGYLVDALKRVSFGVDSAYYHISIKDGVGTFTIESATMKQAIPVISAEGNFDGVWAEKEGVFSDAIAAGSIYWTGDICLSVTPIDDKKFFMKIGSEKGLKESELWNCFRKSLNFAHPDLFWNR